MLTEIQSLPKAAKLYLTYSGISSLYFAWPIFIAYLSGRFGIANVGLYFSVISLTSLFAEVPTGYFADHFGKRFSVIAGIICKMVAILVLVLFTSRLSLLTNAVLYGIGNALISGALDALFYDSVSHSVYEKTVSLEVPFYQSGLVISALVGGLLFQINQHLPVLSELLLLSILVIPIWYLGTPKPHSEHETVVDPKEAFRSIKRIFTRKNSLIFLGVYLAVVGVHELFIELTLEKKMIELSITPFGRGIIIAGIKVLALVVLQGILFKKLKSVRSKAVLAFSSMIIAFPIIGFTSTIAVYLPFYFLTNAATMIRDAYLSPIMQKLSSNRTRATDISMYALVGRIPFAIIAPAATSYLVSHNTRVLFAISALSIILVTPPLFKILAWYDQQTLPN